MPQASDARALDPIQRNPPSKAVIELDGIGLETMMGLSD
jgi:hypothetical protein